MTGSSPVDRRILSIAAFVLLAQVAVAEPEPLTLAEAMAHALNRNPQIAAAVLRVRGAQAGVGLARAAAAPTFSIEAAARRQGPVQQIRMPSAPEAVRITRADHAVAGLAVVWPLWTGGRVSAAADRASAQAQAAEADLQQAVEQLLYLVAATYYGALSADQALVAARSGVEVAEEAHRATAVAHRAGTATSIQLAAAEAELQRARQGLTVAQNRLADARQNFNLHLGRSLQEPVVLSPEPLDMALPAEVNEAVAVALDSRPELLALSRRTESAQAAIAMARAERNPTVALVGQAQLQTPTDVAASHQQFIGLQFSWPVFHHPAASAKEQQARAGVGELMQLRQELERTISLQVEGALRRLADTQEAVEAAVKSLEAVRQSARSAQASYRAGTITRRELVAAEGAETQAEARWKQVRYDVAVAAMSYARALGILRESFLLELGAEQTGQEGGQR